MSDKGQGGRERRGHPLHAAFVHFPLGLLPLSVLWDLLGWAHGAGWIQGDVPWAALTLWTRVAGLVAAAPALVTGWMELMRLPEDHPAGDVAQRHLVVAGSGVALFVLALPGLVPPWLATTSALMGAVVLAWAGWLGGELVFRFGVGATAPRSRE